METCLEHIALYVFHLANINKLPVCWQVTNVSHCWEPCSGDVSRGQPSPDLPPLWVLSPLVTSSVTFNSGNNVTQYTTQICFQTGTTFTLILPLWIKPQFDGSFPARTLSMLSRTDRVENTASCLMNWCKMTFHECLKQERRASF